VASKVSGLCLGGISIGNKWSSIFGRNEDHTALLDAFYSLGGNFIDTSNTYCAEQSETLIGEWMEKRGVRDEMVIATKFAVGYKAYDRAGIKLQSNHVETNAKSMYVSVRNSLKKLRTEYIDIL
jgi:aryl-alcohol dehydrogenase-like predicted oxidoreductase